MYMTKCSLCFFAKSGNNGININDNISMDIKYSEIYKMIFFHICMNICSLGIYAPKITTSIKKKF